jgi:hypothetical protein
LINTPSSNQGCQIFLGTTYQNEGKKPINDNIYQMATKHTNGRKIYQTGRKIDQHLPLQDPPKFTQIGIFGLNLATLFQRVQMQIHCWPALLKVS